MVQWGWARAYTEDLLPQITAGGIVDYVEPKAWLIRWTPFGIYAVQNAQRLHPLLKTSSRVTGVKHVIIGEVWTPEMTS